MNKNLAIWMIFGAVLFVSVNGLEFTDCGKQILSLCLPTK